MALENRLILAPMAGMLRLPVRLAYRRLGAAMTCVGAIDAGAMVRAQTDQLITALGKRETTGLQERPVCVQLVGADPDVLASAALQIEKSASVIDLNFSGPSQRLIDKGHGVAGLLRDPARIREIVAAVTERVSVPVTAKIRIGFDGPDVDIERIVRNCREAGVAAITVHARFVRQMYHGPAQWEWIRRVKESVDIPVIGNGAVHSAHDAKAMLEQTGCDFIMIGTAAFVNPLIFMQTNRLLETGRFDTVGSTHATLRLLWEYLKATRETKSRSISGFLRRSCRDFLRVQAFMRKIQNGETTLE